MLEKLSHIWKLWKWHWSTFWRNIVVCNMPMKSTGSKWNTLYSHLSWNLESTTKKQGNNFFFSWNQKLLLHKDHYLRETNSISRKKNPLLLKILEQLTNFPPSDGILQFHLSIQYIHSDYVNQFHEIFCPQFGFTNIFLFFLSISRNFWSGKNVTNCGFYSHSFLAKISWK